MWAFFLSFLNSPVFKFIPSVGSTSPWPWRDPTMHLIMFVIPSKATERVTLHQNDLVLPFVLINLIVSLFLATLIFYPHSTDWLPFEWGTQSVRWQPKQTVELPLKCTADHLLLPSVINVFQNQPINCKINARNRPWRSFLLLWRHFSPTCETAALSKWALCDAAGLDHTRSKKSATPALFSLLLTPDLLFRRKK